MTRPTSATVIGWLFIGVSALMAFSGAMSLVMWSFFPDDFGPPESEFSDAPWTFRVLFSVFNYFEFFSSAQILLAITGVVAGIGLLKLHSWGRTLTEFLTWFGLVGTVAYTVIWIATVMSMGVQSPPSEEAQPLFLMMVVMAAVMFVAFLVPFVVVLVALRGKKIRAAVSGTPPPVSVESHETQGPAA